MEIRKLNTLRGIAILIVVVSHYSNATNLFGGILGHGAGQFGVMLFFILSGFLMSYLYMDKKFDRGELKKFLVARVARVIPFFFLIVIASYVLNVLGIKKLLYDINSINELLSHLLFFSGTSVLWMVPPVIQFYILFIFFWWVYQKKPGRLYIVIAVLLFFLMFFNFPRAKGMFFGIPFDLLLSQCLPFFIVGVVFGQLYSRFKLPDYLQNNFFLLSILVIPLMFPKISILIMGKTSDMWRNMNVLYSISMVFFFVLFLVPNDNRLLSNRLGDFLGKTSYSLYLLHLPILWQLITPARKFPLFFLFVFLVISLCISYLSYILLENPLRNAIRYAIQNTQRKDGI